MTERERTIFPEDLARLKTAREDADRAYNTALSALDAALHTLPEFPHPPPAPDEYQVTPLNTHWNILDARPAFPAGWRGRLAGFVWTLVEPLFATQQTFNSVLVDHLNRNIAAQREIPKAVASTIGTLQEHITHLLLVESRLIALLQQVTPYVDSKDYEFAGIGRRVAEDAEQQLDSVAALTDNLAAALHSVADDLLKRFEALLARDQRYLGRIDELRGSIAVAQQQLTTLRREVERRRSADDSHGELTATPAVTAGAQAASASSAASSTDLSTLQQARPSQERDSALASPAQAWKYVGFEELYRGSSSDLSTRQTRYLPLFDGASEVLDVGCGRGEFLELLAGQGISARGIDVNHEMVERCHARGLRAEQSDAMAFLTRQPDGSLGGLIALQVVEHFAPDYLLRFIDEAQRALRPGAVLVLETINAACWLAFFESYIRDLTHVRPLHPDTLRYLVTASGFVDVETRFAAPVSEGDRLQPAPRAAQDITDPALKALVDSIDGNVQRLNRLLFTHLDYAIVARRP